MGLRSAKVMKSSAAARGSTTRLACTHPGARWAVGPVCSPARIARPRLPGRTCSGRFGGAYRHRRLRGPPTSASSSGTWRLVQLRPGLVDRPPGRLVHFGELLDLAGAGRPFELEGVADHVGRVEVRLQRPCADLLAARLAVLAEEEPRPGWRWRSQLLLELPQGHRLGILGPRRTRPWGSTRRARPSWPRTVRRDARAALRPHRRRSGGGVRGLRFSCLPWVPPFL